MRWGSFIRRIALRRVVWIVVGLLVYAVASYFGFARAQTIPGCTTSQSGNSASCDTAPQAKAWADAWPRTAHCGSARDPYWDVVHAPANRTFYVQEVYGNGGCGQGAGYRVTRAFSGYVALCPSGGTWNEVTQQCDMPPACSALDPPLGPGIFQTNDHQTMLVCSGGCEYLDNDDTTECERIDGVYWCSSEGWGPTGRNCTAGPESPDVEPPSNKPIDSDGDGTSDGNDPAPNNPGRGSGTDEDGDCGGEGQPECGAPGAGSGLGNTSGGGGNCDTPPSSTGDPILAQIAYQAWATRCAVERLGQGGAGGIGDGDGDGTGDGDGQPDWTKGDGPGIDPDDTDYVEETSVFGLGISTDLLDTSNLFGGSEACPVLPSITIMGQTFNGANIPQWCTLVAVMRAVILIFGALTAINILLGRHT